MNQLSFWNSWHPHSRFFFYFLLLVLASVLVWFGVSYGRSPAPVIRWELLSEIDEVPVAVDQFKVGLFDFSFTADNYVVSETYRGSSIQVNEQAAYAFLLILGLSLIVLSVVISTLRQFWYYFGVLLLIGILISFKLEQLLLFGETDKLGLIVALSLYLPATYYFRSIRPEVGLGPRMLVFTVITLIFALFIAVFSEAAHPVLMLVSYGIIVPVVLSIIFIFLLGHVAISFFLMLVTRSNTAHSKNSIVHFSVLSVVYLANVFLLYLKNAGNIQWEILYLNAFFLLAVLIVIGIWEFSWREIQYQFIFPFNPVGAFVYLTLAIITLATCSYFFATANDPMVETLEDSIVFSQLGYGLLFFLYIIANFVGPLMENKQVYRVMYKPTTFPYGTAQIVGTIAVVAFFLRASMFPFYQAVAGYYNGIGDLNLSSSDTFVAEQYYKLGDQYGYNNHRSNYSLGTLARAHQDQMLAPYYFKEALNKNPTPYALVNYSNALIENNQFFDAMFNVRQGLQQFPDNAYLQNNLALIYGRTSVTDSALLYLQEAMEHADTRKAAEANTLSILARSAGSISFSVDSLVEETVTDPNYIQNQINTLLLYNQRPEASSASQAFTWQMPEDSLLGSFSFAYTYNYLFHQRSEADTTLLRQVALLADKAENGRFNEPLSYGLGLANYARNRVVDAFKILDRLQSLNPFKTGYYNNVLGLWALQQQAPAVAMRYFKKAAQSSFEDAAFREAISLTEATATGVAPDWSSVRTVWQHLLSDSVETSEGVKLVAQDMLKVLDQQALSQYITQEDDAFRYLFLRYRGGELEESSISNVLEAFKDPNYKVLALHDLLRQRATETWPWWNEQIILLKSDRDALAPLGKDYLSWLEVLHTEKTEGFAEIAHSVEQLPEISLWHRHKKQLYQAKRAEVAKDTATARNAYAYLINNPFYEEGFLAALAYLYPEENNILAYQLLLDAIQTNPGAPTLLKAYIRQSILAGLESYAEETLQELKTLIPASEYQQFVKTYQALLEENRPAF